MRKEKVIIGMSGGVDSSVAAAVLINKGYDVIGVTMQMWKGTDTKDAEKVSQNLGIPFHVISFEELFEQKVIKYFKHEYIHGKTPNPCVACNKYIKFGALMQKAEEMGVDYIATGHYANIEYDTERKRFLLKRSIAQKKDQTYVLYNLTQQQLSRILMPLGSFTKDNVRKLAAEIGLNVASKPESQEICFIPDNDYAGYICKNISKQILPGDFVDIEGNVLGKHQGIIHYTIGQRKGLGIALGRPVYVVRIDAENNRVVLGDEKDVFSTSLMAKELNFISIPALENEMKVKAKIRYSAKEEDAVIYPAENNRVKVVFDKPQRAITPGQSIVFYDNDIVVGGGVIDYTI